MLAAAAEGLALNDLADITALSPAALQKQWEFLRRHQFLKPNPDAPDQYPQLSERGSRLHQIAQLLQRAEQFIWLDAFTQGSQSGCWLTSASAPPPRRGMSGNSLSLPGSALCMNNATDCANGLISGLSSNYCVNSGPMPSPACWKAKLTIGYGS